MGFLEPYSDDVEHMFPNQFARKKEGFYEKRLCEMFKNTPNF